jgi:glycosyltransferase involved in cell wall biosynthesis
VVSRYWEEFFRLHGFENISILYNPFETDKFYVKRETIEAFKKRYGLLGKPIVYIGNAQRKKGIVPTYEALKGMDVILVISGKGDVELPVVHLDLSFEEYIVLLHAADAVVTMSLFQEGWNRTAHEAMLCKTPVVGSGRGGMRELLEGGGQIICEDFDALPQSVRYALQHPEIGEHGYAFARMFDMKRFKHDALRIFKEVCECAE